MFFQPERSLIITNWKDRTRKTIEVSKWGSTTLAKGDLVEEIESLKSKDGKDILVYGGANFVSKIKSRK